MVQRNSIYPSSSFPNAHILYKEPWYSDQNYEISLIIVLLAKLWA